MEQNLKGSTTTQRLPPSVLVSLAILHGCFPPWFPRLLGVEQEASFEEIQDARNYLFEVGDGMGAAALASGIGRNAVTFGQLIWNAVTFQRRLCVIDVQTLLLETCRRLPPCGVQALLSLYVQILSRRRQSSFRSIDPTDVGPWVS